MPSSRTLALITRADAAAVDDAVVQLASLCDEAGATLTLAEDERRKFPQLTATAAAGDPRAADMAVVLGGDGTTLRALRLLLGSGVPVLAINFGRFGFLTTAERAGLAHAVRAAIAGEVRIDELPTVEVLRDGLRLGVAVNDVVVSGDQVGRIARLSWSVDGVSLGEIDCDALVVTTPTGSTGYSLSAGGPVLEWGVDAFGVTFVAPHTLTSRPLVLPRGRSVEIATASDRGARLITDGDGEFRDLAPGECVTVRMGPEHARLALLPDVTFLQRYRDRFTN